MLGRTGSPSIYIASLKHFIAKVILLDGKATAQALQVGLRQQAEALQAQRGTPPHLAVVLIGDDPASHTYVSAKRRACQDIGIRSTLIQREDIQAPDLLQTIEEINQDKAIDGLIIQLPLPPHIDVQTIIQHISPDKDVDGFHALNYGRMACNLTAHIPATPLGIITLLKHYQIDPCGKHCVIVGRSSTVGAPLSILLSRNAYPGNATVTLCHSHTKHLEGLTQQADILVAAVGQPGMISAGMVKEGAVVIDVGITRVVDQTRPTGYRLQGDVDFDQVAPRCNYITPVPGGVGPMTIVALLSNTLRAAQQRATSPI